MRDRVEIESDMFIGTKVEIYWGKNHLSSHTYMDAETGICTTGI